MKADLKTITNTNYARFPSSLKVALSTSNLHTLYMYSTWFMLKTACTTSQTTYVWVVNVIVYKITN